MVEATFEQAYPIAARAAQVRATAAVVSGAIPAADLEDFEQEGLTACWLALPKFNPARASLRTFVERVVASRIASLVRAARRAPAQVSLDAVCVWLADGGTDRHDAQFDIERIASVSDGLDRQLISLLLNYSPAEAGRILGLPRSTVHDRILRMRRSFVRAGYSPIGGCQ